MITPGILENVRVISAEKNDKGTLVLTLQHGEEQQGGLLASLNTAHESTASDALFFIWPLKADDRKTTPAEIAADLIKRIEELNNQLSHILGQYMPLKNVVFNAIAGLTSISSDADFQAALENPATREIVINKVYDNYITSFIGYITPLIGPSSAPLRVKFTRASKDKHFANLPRFLPFAEPMSIPAAASKLKFTDYELGFRAGDKKGDRSTYTGHDQSDATVVAGDNARNGSAAETAATNALFPTK